MVLESRNCGGDASGVMSRVFGGKSEGVGEQIRASDSCFSVASGCNFRLMHCQSST